MDCLCMSAHSSIVAVLASSNSGIMTMTGTACDYCCSYHTNIYNGFVIFVLS